MKIFITGAAGFIGSHLANTLCERGHTVIGFDNCSTGHPESLASGVELVRGDINDREHLWRLLQQVDCVYHLAARVVVPESIDYPREFERVNVGGTVRFGALSASCHSRIRWRLLPQAPTSL